MIQDENLDEVLRLNARGNGSDEDDADEETSGGSSFDDEDDDEEEEVTLSSDDDEESDDIDDDADDDDDDEEDEDDEDDPTPLRTTHKEDAVLPVSPSTPGFSYDPPTREATVPEVNTAGTPLNESLSSLRPATKAAPAKKTAAKKTTK